MKNLNIELMMPEGAIINKYDTNSLVEELSGEINFFKESIMPDEEDIKPNKKISKSAQGGIESASWLITFIEDHPEITMMLIGFIKHIGIWAITKLTDNTKKEKKEEVSTESHKLILVFGKQKLELPNTEEEIKKFIVKIQNK